MDLSFARFDRTQELQPLSGDLAVLLVGVAARQAASPTAAVQAAAEQAPDIVDDAERRLFAPDDGAFNGDMAAAINRWSEP